MTQATMTATRIDPDALLALPPAAFIAAIAEDATLLDDPRLRARDTALRANSSVCSYCGVGCPYTVEPDSQGAAKIFPLSDLGLCVKGKTSLMTGSDQERVKRLARRGIADDRIRAPMLRGHDGKMREVTWDEALDRAAWLFLHAREWVGPDAVAIYGNGQKTIEAIWMASLYKLVFRLPTIGANSEHCLTSAGAAHQLNFGNEASFTWRQFDELLECDVAVMHGTNAYVTFPQAYEKIKRNTRAVKVVIDPVRSDTVSDLQDDDPRTLHVRFRQGGDVKFNLAVARVIFDNGWEDRDSIQARVDPESEAAFRALCAQDRFRAEDAADSIALPGQDVAELAAMIRRYAELIAKPQGGTIQDGHRPGVAFVSSMGVNQSTGAYGFSTNLNLLLLTGAVGRRGAGSMRVAGQSNATSELMMGFNGRKLVFNHDPDNPAHRAALARVLDLPEENIPAHKGTPVSQMAEDDRIYCFLFVGTQMTKNMPRVGHWARRMGRSFNIVIDSFLADGVLEHADVLLPSMTYVERTGVIQRGDRSLQLQQRLSEPPEKAWADEQILARLALKIAERLRDPDTAELNGLDPDVVHRTFARYLDNAGNIRPDKVFDHVVEVSRELDMYCRLEDAAGVPISHASLRANAGMGVQWGGNGRYAPDGSAATAFPGLHGGLKAQARLVCPPDAFLARLDAKLPAGTLSLISGRGRPGRQALRGRGRYNSGIKTLPIYGLDPDDHFVELHPEQAAELGVKEGDAAKIVSDHGAVIAEIACNDRIPRGAAFIDFVPGEVNRLTDYVEADQFTHQSLIKRTPVQVQGLRRLEARLWESPDGSALIEATDTLFADWRAMFPTDAAWIDTQRDSPDRIDWLPSAQLRDPQDDTSVRLSEAVGAMTAFFQRYGADTAYRQTAGAMLRGLDTEPRDRFLCVLLPLIRRLDYHSVLHRILSDFVGGVTVIGQDGKPVELNLLSAHKSAVLEFKEEIVAIQLFIAAKRGLDHLFGPGAVVKRDDLAFVSGVAIPCAGDVPAHFLGISPADLGATLLVHSRAIGNSALIVVDRATNRAVRVDVVTGVLPKDRELTRLRGVVINRKLAATGKEHRRFFDRLGELIVDYVRTGDDNFKINGPVPLDWTEYQAKLSFSPAHPRAFVNHLVQQRISPELADALVGLTVLDEAKDAEALIAIRTADPCSAEPIAAFDRDELYAGTLTERVDRVVEQIIAPVLANDGGRLDILDLNETIGELSVRFVGSCANCPYSLLSMEQIVKPTLLAIPGIQRVTHRARARDHEVEAARLRVPVHANVGTAVVL